MPSSTQFNTKSPTIKRILKEAAELASNVSPDYHAEPLESNLFEWHFTLRGPPAPSPYAGGIYHGRIVLPTSYPLRPPSFRFMTPSGRFEVNREICLSISGHHEETWQPAWGIRTALVAIRSFMDTDPKGQVGGMDSTPETRKKLAMESTGWRCPGCGKSNGQIIKEREEAAEAEGVEQTLDEEVPEELRLSYREDLSKEKEEGNAKTEALAAQTADSEPRRASQEETVPVPLLNPGPSLARSSPVPRSGAALPAPLNLSARPAQATSLQRPQQQDDPIPSWVDKAILGVVLALALMILRKYVF